MSVGGIPLMVTARINHCNSPIDVTFLVRSIDPNSYNSVDEENSDASHFSANPQVQQFFRGLNYENRTSPPRSSTQKPSFKPKIKWQYTFVTTNQPESREIPGFYTSEYQGNC